MPHPENYVAHGAPDGWVSKSDLEAEAFADEREKMRASLRSSYVEIDDALSSVERDIEDIVENLDTHRAATLQARLEMATARLLGRALS